jgi:hypothetical protein
MKAKLMLLAIFALLTTGSPTATCANGYCDDFWSTCALQCGGENEICYSPEDPGCNGAESWCFEDPEWSHCACRFR